MPEPLPPHMHRFPMIGGNGGFIAIGGNIISTIHFDKPIADLLLKLIRTYEAEYLIDSRWDYAYSGSDEHPIRRNIDPEQRAKNIQLDELQEILKMVILRSLNAEKMLEELQRLPVVLYLHGAEEEQVINKMNEIMVDLN
ncbi:hypothetical protein [Paenibacillus sp. L3-i20]|uniref:hypothetical protein n=1 Tax=Paenibacillus sp. L3-i20 TaxID=2905833 RepID=UPI001EDDA26E|nr:hypothetical protein [Paenibacillus sp. L3-i20]